MDDSASGMNEASSLSSLLTLLISRHRSIPFVDRIKDFLAEQVSFKLNQIKFNTVELTFFKFVQVGPGRLVEENKSATPVRFVGSMSALPEWTMLQRN